LRPSHFVAACADLAAIPQNLEGMTLRYAAMQLPVRIIFGRDDRILSHQEQGETLAAILPGATLTLIDGGHMLPVTAPGVVAQLIREAAAASTRTGRGE
jgi:pimeloyl-ACP methyl ester carboxylesterase